MALLPGDHPINVEMFCGDNVPQMIEITYADGERLVLRASSCAEARRLWTWRVAVGCPLKRQPSTGVLRHDGEADSRKERP